MCEPVQLVWAWILLVLHACGHLLSLISTKIRRAPLYSYWSVLGVPESLELPKPFWMKDNACASLSSQYGHGFYSFSMLAVTCCP